MSLGTRIIQLRNQKGMTQKVMSERTGLAGSYLSRIENRHLEPRPQTLRKIAAALEVPVSELFQEHSAKLGTLECVITSTGHCVMDLLRSSRKPSEPHLESYSPRQLQLLRMANYLIQTGNERLLDSLDVLLDALLNAERRKLREGEHIPSTSPESPAPPAS